MDEHEWAACGDSGKMLKLLRGKASDRKLNLFACGCCRQVLLLAGDATCLQAVEAAELHADGEVSVDALVQTWEPLSHLDPDSILTRAQRLRKLVYYATAPVALRSGTITSVAWEAALSIMVKVSGREETVPASGAEGRAAQVALLRDLFGNPFRPPPPIPASVLQWNQGLVRRLAEEAYEKRQMPAGTLDSLRLTVLADALEEAGADDGLIAHLREAGPHYRGCHTLDFLLGKS